MLHLKAKHNLSLDIDSAGTASYHIGEAPDKRTIANARKNGVDLSLLRARQFQSTDLDTFDMVYVMDKSNLANVLALAKNDTHKKKIKLFLNAVYEDIDAEVPDPYYGSEREFEAVFQLVYKACETMVSKLPSAGA